MDKKEYRIAAGTEKEVPYDSAESSSESEDEGLFTTRSKEFSGLEGGFTPQQAKESLEQFKIFLRIFEPSLDIDTVKEFYHSDAGIKILLRASKESKPGELQLGRIYARFIGAVMVQFVRNNGGPLAFHEASFEDWKLITEKVLGLLFLCKCGERNEIQFSDNPLLISANSKKKLDRIAEEEEGKAEKKEKPEEGEEDVEFAMLSMNVKCLTAERYRLKKKIEEAEEVIQSKDQEIAALKSELDNQKKLYDISCRSKEALEVGIRELEEENFVYKERVDAGEDEVFAFLDQAKKYEIQGDGTLTQIRTFKMEADEGLSFSCTFQSKREGGNFPPIDFSAPRTGEDIAWPKVQAPDTFLLPKIPNIFCLREIGQHNYIHESISELLVHFSTVEIYSEKGILPLELYVEMKKFYEERGIWIPGIFKEAYEKVKAQVKSTIDKEQVLSNDHRCPPEENPGPFDCEPTGLGQMEASGSAQGKTENPGTPKFSGNPSAKSVFGWLNDDTSAKRSRQERQKKPKPKKQVKQGKRIV